MYNVMIVDDETIILSGIRSLVDWEKNDCVLAATARSSLQLGKLISFALTFQFYSLVPVFLPAH